MVTGLKPLPLLCHQYGPDIYLIYEHYSNMGNYTDRYKSHSTCTSVAIMLYVCNLQTKYELCFITLFTNIFYCAFDFVTYTITIPYHTINFHVSIAYI